MKLTNRLQAIADLVKKNSIVADIGSDHGYLVANLVENNIVKRAIASDINKGPVQNCIGTILSRDLGEFIEVRLGGGFIPYKEKEVDTAIIAGMGGQLIRDIMIESKAVVDTIETFILQPMTAQDELRKWLINNNFSIANEIVTNEQGRFYEILVVKHGSSGNLLDEELKSKLSFEETDEIFLEIGYKVDLERSAYNEFLGRKIQKYEMIINQIKSNENSVGASIEVMKVAENKLQKIKEVKTCTQILKK